MVDAFLTTLSTLTEEDKKDVLVETAKVAEAAFDRRTEVMSGKVDDVNAKLEAFVRNYTENQKRKEEEEIKEEQEESSAE